VIDACLCRWGSYAILHLETARKGFAPRCEI
jgi:hypothetical protein